MNTALVATGAVPSRPGTRPSTLAERLVLRAGLAFGWSRTTRHSLSREELVVLHERRREAEHLREANFRDVTFARLF
ncbi:hypothetical protein [Agromyces ramosus]|uniref:Uncharacterized protein n=1 Tax=Agromyces ramosus TaxID=33879 RepID=A0ABU0R915_9MICO|nr:hypothetical protein [Agromyces ramosus]MDQ0894573.1 hypothetical protein [Agromyces ramosus]